MLALSGGWGLLDAPSENRVQTQHWPTATLEGLESPTGNL